jgi:4-oxalocrotonate tautomerase
VWLLLPPAQDTRSGDRIEWKAPRDRHGQNELGRWLEPHERGSDLPLPLKARNSSMPYVTVRITRDGVTAEEKARVVAEITDTLRRVLGKRPEHTHVVIDEIEPENRGCAGMLTPAYRASLQQQG